MSAPTPFLRLVADTFKQNCSNVLQDYCFVFPNRRSCVFFEKELKDDIDTPFLAPAITTISDFLSDTTHKVECGRVQLLLELYKAYTEITDNNGDNFDKFAFWGDVIINDFNDIDRYLVNHNDIFRNLKDLNEIGTDFLSDEQKTVIKEFFGKDIDSNSDGGFWKHMNNESDSEIVSKYIELWNILNELYDRLNSNLSKLGLAYSGQIYRDAVNIIDNLAPEDFSFKKYIFVGFNVLSTSETKIFKLLKEKGIADFYWDCNSPVLQEDNIASRFLKSNISGFKSTYDLNETPITEFPQIHVLAIPSDIGQTKYASAIVDKLIGNHEISDIDNPIDTSIVLPEEELFIPLVTSVSDKIHDLNVTMGYPLKNSSISSLIGGIATMHRQARYENDECKYYHEDVKLILSHPFMKIVSASETDQALALISDSNAFYVSANGLMAAAPVYKYIFTPLKASSSGTTEIESLVKYVDNVLQFIQDCLIKISNVNEKSIEIGFVCQYMELFQQLKEIIRKYDNIEMNDDTFFFLIDRFISSASVAFEGEPLKGLQVMGILETRCLDFKNLIILSMNEGVFPRKHFSKSFIPYELRNYFGMATMEHQECIYAYYFYRMISRATNVYILYDARARENASGEPSRYIQQLATLYPKSNVNSRFIGFNLQSSGQTIIKVHKDKRIMSILNSYRNDEQDGCKYLSASAINTYINCPLQFYLEKVEGMRIEDEMSEFMDYSTFGTIIHAILKDVYDKKGIIDKSYIENLLSKKVEFRNRVKKWISNQGNDKIKILLPTGEIAIIMDIAIKFVENVLNYDKHKPFEITQSEKEEKGVWDLGDGLKFNFKQYIDRVDKCTDETGYKILRIIDYKTGKDATTVASIDDMFKAKKQDRAKAILQTFLYCNFYAMKNHFIGAIQPLIYKIKNLQESEIRIGKDVVTDYLKYNESFLENLRATLSALFDEDTPFTQAENETHCSYCKFKDFCRK